MNKSSCEILKKRESVGLKKMRLAIDPKTKKVSGKREF